MSDASLDRAPVIRDGRSDDIEALVDIFVDSFTDDPFLNWIMPEPRIYPGFFRLIIEELFLPKGVVHIDSAGRGAALWLPPGVPFDVPFRPTLLFMFVRIILKNGLTPVRRIRRQGELFGKYLPGNPHYHLLFIGCRQNCQGQGVGSALLKHGNRMPDTSGNIAYLESSRDVNVPLYERHGYEVIGEGSLPGGGPTAWFMLREPQTDP
ncbi:MAG: GNAT family N-acetyltransferase [Pseudomonadota bacterium]